VRGAALTFVRRSNHSLGFWTEMQVNTDLRALSILRNQAQKFIVSDFSYTAVLVTVRTSAFK
jgi:hypothetical protein